MDWTDVIVLCLFGIACLLAIHQSRTEDWNLGQKIGTGIFFLGVVVGLFLDELLGVAPSRLPWAEPLSAVIILIGLVVSWSSRSSRPDSK